MYAPRGLCASLSDIQFMEHSVNVEADSLHDAVAKAVQVFRNNPAPIKKPGWSTYPGSL